MLRIQQHLLQNSLTTGYNPPAESQNHLLGLGFGSERRIVLWPNNGELGSSLTMYADQVEAQSNRSIRERLNGATTTESGRRVPVPRKRQREDDDKWEHDLFEDGGTQVSNRIGEKDLRLKLQRKNMERATQSVRGSIARGARDLREKLSGTLYSRPVESVPPPVRPKPTTEVTKPTRRSVIAEAAPVSEAKNVASPVPKKKAKQMVESVDNFLQSLGLEKYSITFQAEEVDMTALMHMSDEDLKALGIPMGPRKKILLALEAKV